MIPKTLHQVWTGSLPVSVEKSMLTWERNLPAGWKRRFWDEEALAVEFVDFTQWKVAYSEPRFLANRVRLELLKRFGGWYADGDTVLLDGSRLDNLPSADIVLTHWRWYTKGNPKINDELLDNYWIGAPQGSPVLGALANMIPKDSEAGPTVTKFLRKSIHEFTYAALPTWQGDIGLSEPWALHMTPLEQNSLDSSTLNSLKEDVKGGVIGFLNCRADSLNVGAPNVRAVETSRRWHLWQRAVLGEDAIVRKAPPPLGKFAELFHHTVSETFADCSAVVVDGESAGFVDAALTVGRENVAPLWIKRASSRVSDVVDLKDALGRSVLDFGQGLVKLAPASKGGKASTL